MNSVAAIPKLGPRDAGSRIGAAEFALADFAPPYRYERVAGRLVVLEPRSASHRELSRPFRFELGGYYVIVDRFKDAALVLTWQPGDYAERILTATDIYTTPLLPGLSIPLNDAFNPPLPAGDTPPPNPPTTSP
jgi:hypothetical protein